MSGGLSSRQGLSLKLRYEPTRPTAQTLRRVTEISVVGDATFIAQAPALIRAHGLNIAIQLARTDFVSLTFGACQKGGAPVDPQPVTPTPIIGDAAAELFEVPKPQWTGFFLPRNLIKPDPITYAAENDALYFDLTVRFNPGNAQKFNHVMTIIATLGLATFEDHFVMGIGVVNTGSALNGVNFESTFIADPTRLAAPPE